MDYKADDAIGMMLMRESDCTELHPQTMGSAGIDLEAAEDAVVEYGKITIVPTKIYSVMPRGFCGLVCSRSGLAAKYGLMVVNAPGVIDSDYRYEIQVILTKVKNDGVPYVIDIGDHIAQLIFVPIATSDSSNQSERIGGLGSTGR